MEETRMTTISNSPAAASSKATAKKSTKPAAKAVAKTSEKTTTKPAVKAAKPDTVTPISQAAIPPSEKDSKPAKPAVADKQPKVKKAKLVRDSFTIPKDEYLVIDTLKQRSAKLGQPMKKSELLRAGIKLLHSLDEAHFRMALAAVPAIKTGRPKKTK